MPSLQLMYDILDVGIGNRDIFTQNGRLEVEGRAGAQELRIFHVGG
jgi:hypothetical protein